MVQGIRFYFFWPKGAQFVYKSLSISGASNLDLASASTSTGKQRKHAHISAESASMYPMLVSPVILGLPKTTCLSNKDDNRTELIMPLFLSRNVAPVAIIIGGCCFAGEVLFLRI